ncbi:MAG: hypothetical protein ABSG55_05345 [Dehalococcoidia bacterium]|jgi:hypothetical protein
MRKIVIAAVVGVCVMLASVATAGAAIMQTRLQSTGDRHLNGMVLWAQMSETRPIALLVNGVKPGSQVVLKVCGPSMNGDAGTIADRCWTTFKDREHYNSTIDVDRRGKVRTMLYAKLGVGPTFLIRPARFELYASTDLTHPIAVGQLRSRK